MNKTISKTELLYKKSKPIDQLNILDGINLMVNEQIKAGSEVKKSAGSIEIAINMIYEHLNFYKKGRIIYVGAGTSGRIGVQDGVELFPTFNWPKARLDYIIAGGSGAILNVLENAEDDLVLAENIVSEKLISSHDVVIGLAASGNTPFTCKVMEKAKNQKALTVSISNNPMGNILNFGSINIILDTKEEVIARVVKSKDIKIIQVVCLRQN